MTNDLLKLAAVSVFALSLASGPLGAQETFGDWDANTDGGIDAAEFETRLGETGLFGAWDTDADESLSEAELDAALGDRDVDYSAWDGDGDGLIRESEFLSGLYNNYDVDTSGSLDEEEFGAFGDEAFFDK